MVHHQAARTGLKADYFRINYTLLHDDPAALSKGGFLQVAAPPMDVVEAGEGCWELKKFCVDLLSIYPSIYIYLSIDRINLSIHLPICRFFHYNLSTFLSETK